MKLKLAQILLEQSEFKHKGDYLGQEPSTPIVNAPVDLGIELLKEPDLSTALVRLRASSDPDSGYAFSVVYSGILNLDFEGQEPVDNLDRRLMVTGATMLFPFIREVVANLSMRGRFGPTWLAPTDFNKVVGDPSAVEEVGPIAGG